MFLKRLKRAFCLVGLAAIATLLQGSGNLNSLRVVATKTDRYIALKDLASFYGLPLRMSGNSIVIDGKWNNLEFETNSRKCVINGVCVWLNSSTARIGKRWFVTEADVRKTIDPLVRSHLYLDTRGYRVVMLDPGHGGHDRGARGARGVEEKRVVLDVAKKVRAQLANAGLKVYMTRETDRFIELSERPIAAARCHADLFVSIHVNATASKSARGYETYLMGASGYPATAGGRNDSTSYMGNRHDAANMILAYQLQKAMVDKMKGEDRGVRRARFMVLKNAPCPAVLVECGFVSNPTEESLMLNRAHRQQIAMAISRGILEYLNAVKRSHVAKP